jgi:uncharacterized membrane protein YphA (DoxX/SURF4 family)
MRPRASASPRILIAVAGKSFSGPVFFRELPPGHERFMTANGFFEHLGLVGGFLLVAWYDFRDGRTS